MGPGFVGILLGYGRIRRFADEEEEEEKDGVGITDSYLIVFYNYLSFFLPLISCVHVTYLLTHWNYFKKKVLKGEFGLVRKYFKNHRLIRLMFDVMISYFYFNN